MMPRHVMVLVLSVLITLAAVAALTVPQMRADRGLSLLNAVGAPLLLLGGSGFGLIIGGRRRLVLKRLADSLRQVSVKDGEFKLTINARGEMAELVELIDKLLAELNEKAESRQLALREEQIRSRVLRADKRNMEAVLNSIADAVLVTDPFGEVKLANQSAESALKFKFDTVNRCKLTEIVSDSRLLATVDQLARSDISVPRKVIEMPLGENGDSRTYKATINAVRSQEQERLTGIVTVLHDVTRERESAKLKNDFVSKVVHELRTPLSSIRAYVEMLVDGEANSQETALEFYKIIDSESDRLSRMIENLLNISRIEAGVIKVQKTDIALTGIVKETVDVLQPQAAEKGLTLQSDLPPLFYQVHADRDMLYQAVLNIISNAIKYTPDGGAITVTSGVENGMAFVRVSDNGMGIPAEDVPRLFEKFYRVGQNKRAAKGTGLGLALVKEIIETLHHGRVTVESEVNKGSVFTLELPVVE